MSFEPRELVKKVGFYEILNNKLHCVQEKYQHNVYDLNGNFIEKSKININGIKGLGETENFLFCFNETQIRIFDKAGNELFTLLLNLMKRKSSSTQVTQLLLVFDDILVFRINEEVYLWDLLQKEVIIYNLFKNNLGYGGKYLISTKDEIISFQDNEAVNIVPFDGLSKKSLSFDYQILDISADRSMVYLVINNSVMRYDDKVTKILEYPDEIDKIKVMDDSLLLVSNNICSIYDMKSSSFTASFQSDSKIKAIVLFEDYVHLQTEKKVFQLKEDLTLVRDIELEIKYDIVEFQTNGAIFGILDKMGVVYVYNSETMKRIGQVKLQFEKITSFAIGEALLYCGTEKGAIIVSSYRNFKVKRYSFSPNRSISKLVLVPNYVYIFHNTGEIKFIRRKSMSLHAYLSNEPGILVQADASVSKLYIIDDSNKLTIVDRLKLQQKVVKLDRRVTFIESFLINGKANFLISDREHTYTLTLENNGTLTKKELDIPRKEIQEIYPIKTKYLVTRSGNTFRIFDANESNNLVGSHTFEEISNLDKNFKFTKELIFFKNSSNALHSLKNPFAEFFE